MIMNVAAYTQGATELPQFPVPVSGVFEVIPLKADLFEVSCSGLNSIEQPRLQGFHELLRGREGI